MLKGLLEKAGFDVIDDGVKALWNPDEASLEECREYGRRLAKEFGSI